MKTVNWTTVAKGCGLVFLFLQIADTIIHGHLMMDMYAKTASLWRSEAEMMMWPILVSNAIFAFFMSFLFAKGHENNGWMEGLRFGFYIGCIHAAVAVGSYGYMPITCEIATSWVLADLCRAMGGGFLLAWIYQS